MRRFDWQGFWNSMGEALLEGLREAFGTFLEEMLS